MSRIGYEETHDRVGNALANGYTPSFYTVAGAMRALGEQAAQVDMSEALFLKIAKVAHATARGRDLTDERFLTLCGLRVDEPEDTEDGA